MYRESKFCICLRHCFGNLMATERISLTGRGGGGPRGSGVLLGVVGAGVSSAGRRRSISELSDDHAMPAKEEVQGARSYQAVEYTELYTDHDA